ncbi:triose-phosphate isomerase family protein [Chitinimonas naiadis]
MGRKLLVGNWKMNGSLALAEQMAARLIPLSSAKVGLWLCPSALHGAQLARLLADSPLGWGVQDVSAHTAGAHTGDISAVMAQELGAICAIIGHSERRTGHAERDELVAAKALACLQAGLTPVICVGESAAERAAGKTDAVLAQQLAPILAQIASDQLPRLIVAYEPIWAIGSGKAAGAAEIIAAHASIRRLFEEQAAGLGAEISVLYGGSLCASNAIDLFSLEGVDGGLAGGASLKPDEFAEIYQLALQHL